MELKWTDASVETMELKYKFLGKDKEGLLNGFLAAFVKARNVYGLDEFKAMNRDVVLGEIKD